jgi:hypothetical protein
VIEGTWSGTITYSANQTGPVGDSGGSADRSTQATLSLTQFGRASGEFGFNGDYGQSVKLTDYTYNVRETVVGINLDDHSPCSWEYRLATSSPVTGGIGVLYEGSGGDNFDGELTFYADGNHPHPEPTIVTEPEPGPDGCFAHSAYETDRIINRGGLDVCLNTSIEGNSPVYELPPVPVRVVDGRKVMRGQTSRTYSDPACTVTVGFDLTFTPGPPSGPCDGVKKKRTSRRDKATTNVPFAAEIDWYRAKLTTTYCVKKGKAWITGMKLKPTIKNGLIPRLLGKFGWLSLNPEKPEYSPIRKGGAVSASASTTYVMCFDPVVFLDKTGLKGQLQKRMKKPLRKALAKILRKAGLTKISPTVRRKAMVAFKKRVDHAFRKGTIRTYLQKKKHVPERIARLAEKVAKKNEGALKSFLKGDVAQTMETGRYDLAAGPAADLMIDDAFGLLGRLTAFCGGRAAEKSNFRMWTITYDANRKGKKVKISKDDLYKHPILSVRRYHGGGTSGGGAW